MCIQFWIMYGYGCLLATFPKNVLLDFDDFFCDGPGLQRTINLNMEVFNYDFWNDL